MRGALRRILKSRLDDEDDIETNVVAVATLLETQRRHEIRQPVPNEVKTRQRVHRKRVDADARMMHQYFKFNCTYGPKKFKGRFALPRPLFLRILEQVCEFDHDLNQQTDVCSIPGHSPYMKMVAVMKHFAKGIAPDSLDDYTQMGATTIYHYAMKFMDAIIWIYNGRYMRQPTAQDTERILAENESRGFPGMLGSVDCFHWAWRADEYQILQLLGVAPPCHYQINGKNYDQGYYLGDGAYPMYGCIVQGYKPASNIREGLFNQYQEAKRKDIKRAFGGLKGKFGIILKPCRYYKKSDTKAIMRGCLIMHNMCVEVEYRNADWVRIMGDEPQPPIQGNVRLPPHILYNSAIWAQLRLELTTHIWNRHGECLRDGDIPNMHIDDALPEVHESITDVDTDEDQYDPQGDGAFYENGE
ncbi:uncharacterized protein LOC113313000 [Papaver somniferum]|uniref:uncharacterized protein LOC113313000 n=1 Tax=Papaver somniferum TaxID=3469 RepID=UPI000E6FC2CB|nr:uncharacterized protein LOC113313000 [Papaver somniferum]